MGDEFVLEEVVELELIPDGEILQAEVIKAEKQTKPWKDENDNDIVKVSFLFRITEEGPFYDRKVYGETPLTFSTHSDCKLRIWVQELLGQDQLMKGFKFNTEMLSDLPCRVAVGQRTSQKTKKTSNFVADVIRASSVRMAEEIF